MAEEFIVDTDDLQRRMEGALSVMKGVKIIEKHFTIDKSMYGPDHSGSMTPDELIEICNYRDNLKECL